MVKKAKETKKKESKKEAKKHLSTFHCVDVAKQVFALLEEYDDETRERILDQVNDAIYETRDGQW